MSTATELEARVAARKEILDAIAKRRQARVWPGQVWQMPSSRRGRTIRVTSLDGRWVEYELLVGSGPPRRRLTVDSLLASYRPVPAARDLTAGERLMARHLLRELLETASAVRNGIEPSLGAAEVTDLRWVEQWSSMTRSLDRFTEEVVKRGRP